MLAGMMDTHSLLWLMDDDPRLSVTAKKTIARSAGRLALSVISVWEIAIKVGNGKLSLPLPLDEYLAEAQQKYEFEILPLQTETAVFVSTLPFPLRDHKDPYDRILISQCLVLSIPMISNEEKFDAYGIQRIW